MWSHHGKMSNFPVIGCVVGSFFLKPTLEGNAEEWEDKLFQKRNLNRNINIVSERQTMSVRSYSIFLLRTDPTHWRPSMSITSPTWRHWASLALWFPSFWDHLRGWPWRPQRREQPWSLRLVSGQSDLRGNLPNLTWQVGKPKKWATSGTVCGTWPTAGTWESCGTIARERLRTSSSAGNYN